MEKIQKFSKGLTLIELMVTLVVLAILAGVAAPGMIDLVRSNRLTSQTNLFATALAIARSESIKRNVNVVICKRDGTSCDNSKNWEDGWVIFADLDADQQLDGGEETIRLFEGLSSGYTLRVGNTYTNWIRYMPKGDVIGSGGTGAAVFRLCAADAQAVNDTGRSRSLNISFSGHVRLSEGTTACP